MFDSTVRKFSNSDWDDVLLGVTPIHHHPHTTILTKRGFVTLRPAASTVGLHYIQEAIRNLFDLPRGYLFGKIAAGYFKIDLVFGSLAAFLQEHKRLNFTLFSFA